MAISLSSAAMDFSVLRGPWPGDRQAGWRRGSHERKIGAGGTRLVYFIIGESCATRKYCQRGRMENLLKAHKLHLASDRTSCTRACANQVRLFLHGAAYWLLWTF